MKPNYNLAHIEMEVIKAVLRMTNNNKELSAKILGITTKTLYNKLHKNNLMGQYKKGSEGETNVTE